MALPKGCPPIGHSVEIGFSPVHGEPRGDRLMLCSCYISHLFRFVWAEFWDHHCPVCWWHKAHCDSSVQSWLWVDRNGVLRWCIFEEGEGGKRCKGRVCVFPLSMMDWQWSQGSEAPPAREMVRKKSSPGSEQRKAPLDQNKCLSSQAFCFVPWATRFLKGNSPLLLMLSSNVWRQ